MGSKTETAAYDFCSDCLWDSLSDGDFDVVWECEAD